MVRDPGGGAGRSSRAAGRKRGVSEGEVRGGGCLAGACTSICRDRGVRGAIFVSNKRRRGTAFACETAAGSGCVCYQEIPRGNGEDGANTEIRWLSGSDLAAVRPGKLRICGRILSLRSRNERVREVPRAKCFSKEKEL